MLSSRWHKIYILALMLGVVSCGTTMTSRDAGRDANALSDAETLRDAGTFDAGPGRDAAMNPPLDAAMRDAESAMTDATLEDADIDAGAEYVGRIRGTCGALDTTELSDTSTPFFFVNRIDFAMTFEMADRTRLSSGAQEIYADGTAGGSSVDSEAFAFEVLHRCEGASLIKTETEIVYTDPMSKKTDLLVEIDGERIGVSVTRAVTFPRDAAYTVERARALLEDKLGDIPLSSAAVSPMDSWTKQILHIIAYDEMHAMSLRTAWEALPASTRADTVVWVTITDGMDAFLY